MVPEQEKLTLKSLMKVIRDSNDELTSHINKTTDIQTSRTKIELSLSTLADRRSNIKITNIPEKSEGSDTVGYLESLIPQLLGNDNFTSPITLERAHRLGRPSDWTRHIIAKFLNYREKDKVLRLAREKGAVYLNDKQISFFPDYSVEIQRKINGFNGVKKKLREKNIEYGGFKLFSTQKMLISNTDIIYHNILRDNPSILHLFKTPISLILDI
uniref:L1 transposable element RRM domain-containing protein n=1 Tax=Sinocyclocheilus anshuiensis TaxID=1608454 RepID=A0A671KF25_9TELE